MERKNPSTPLTVGTEATQFDLEHQPYVLHLATCTVIAPLSTMEYLC